MIPKTLSGVDRGIYCRLCSLSPRQLRVEASILLSDTTFSSLPAYLRIFKTVYPFFT